MNAQITITNAFSSTAPAAWGAYANQRFADAVANGDEDAAACWAPDGGCRAAGHMFFGGLAGGIGGALGSGVSSLLAPGLADFLRQNDLPEPMVQAFVQAASLIGGSIIGGAAGAAGAYNETSNNALLSRRAIERLMEDGGFEAMRTCLASPRCVQMFDSETASKLYIALRTTDVINHALQGLQDTTIGNSQINYQSSGGLIGQANFFDSFNFDPSTIVTRPDGSVSGQLPDGTFVTKYPFATSTEGPSVTIRRPWGTTTKVRF